MLVNWLEYSILGDIKTFFFSVSELIVYQPSQQSFTTINMSISVPVFSATFFCYVQKQRARSILLLYMWQSRFFLEANEVPCFEGSTWVEMFMILVPLPLRIFLLISNWKKSLIFCPRALLNQKMALVYGNTTVELNWISVNILIIRTNIISYVCSACLSYASVFIQSQCMCVITSLCNL